MMQDGEKMRSFGTPTDSDERGPAAALPSGAVARQLGANAVAGLTRPTSTR